MTSTQPITRATHDPLAHGGETPDVGALITEFQLALNGEHHGGQGISLRGAEAARYNARNGRDGTGRLRQKNCASGTEVRPYDNRPDTDSELSDAITNAQVDIDLTTLHRGRPSVSATNLSPMTATEIGQVTGLINWMRKGPLAEDLIDDGELLSQVKNMNGWAVLHPCWRTKYSIKQETVTLDAVVALAEKAALAVQQAAAQGASAPGELQTLANLPVLIADPTLEDAAVELVRQAYPTLANKRAAQKIVRELRTTGTATFPVRELVQRGPALEALIPGVNFFCSAETAKLKHARLCVKLENYSQARLEAKELSDDWDPDFIAAAIGTMGYSSIPNASALVDENSRNIEILTAYVFGYDAEQQCEAIYCTVFSAHVPDQYATHYVVESAHGEQPFIAVRTEVLGLRPCDSRGIPENTRTAQFAVKDLQDGVLIDSELSTPSMIKRIGGTMSKLPLAITPGGVFNGPPGTGFEAMNLTQYSKPEQSLKLIEMFYRRMQDYHGLPTPNTESHPSRWQMRQSRNGLRWLSAWGQAFWQLALMCLEEYSPEELTAILGTQPTITAAKLLRHHVQLDFDTRMLDNEWMMEVAKTLSQFVFPIDRTGATDYNKFVRMVLASMFPGMENELSRDEAGAQQAVFNEVAADVAWIMQGNEARGYVEKDPTAGMKLQYLQQILSRNPQYQAVLTPVLPTAQGPQPNPQFNALVFTRLKKYEENLQHSFQQTQISPSQGRTGVTPSGMEGGPPQVLPDLAGMKG